MQFTAAVVSKSGGRDHNEDRCGSITAGNFACWVLADGLGGHGGGEVASQIAVTTILAEFEKQPASSPESVLAVITAANQRLRERQAAEIELKQMRTTTVVLLSDTVSACWGHIGDSRLYRFREGRVLSQTRDHSVPQSLVDAGKITADEIRFHPDRNRMLRALGGGEDPRPSVEPQPATLASGDAFLMCSDGFWEYVTETEMLADWACVRRPDDWLERMERRIWRRAPEDHDNYSAIAVFVQ